MKRKLLRKRNAAIAGICAGIGEYFGDDPIIWRLVFIFGTILSGFFPGIFIYLLMWIIVPREEDTTTKKTK
jgi:phage shock protein PspC (stress-responsive transcriptional regulator)